MKKVPIFKCANSFNVLHRGSSNPSQLKQAVIASQLLLKNMITLYKIGLAPDRVSFHT